MAKKVVKFAPIRDELDLHSFVLTNNSFCCEFLPRLHSHALSAIFISFSRMHLYGTFLVFFFFVDGIALLIRYTLVVWHDLLFLVF